MQRFLNARTLFILLIGATFFYSCTEDENPIPNTTPPSISLLTETGLISEDDTISAGQAIMVRIDALAGENQMNTLVVQRDGIDLDLSEISYNGSPAAANPTLLFGDDRDAFTWDASITPHDLDDAQYTFIVTGDGDNTEDAVSVTITIEDAEPELSINVTNMLEAPVGSLAGFTLSGVTNGVDFSTITIWQDGAVIGADRIRCNDVGVNGNPFDLQGSDITGFSDKSMAVEAGDVAGIQNYTVVVENVNGVTASADFTINATPVGTPVGSLFTGVLLENASGPNATGGINLYDGETVSVNANNAHVIDLGNNTANTAWQERIGGDNGGTIRAISADQIDAGLTLSGFEFNEDVETAYNQGVVLNNNESDVVEIGDIFFVNVDNDYFALEVVEKGVTMAGLGFYQFNILSAEF